jgi:hypothetical protein
MLKHIALEIDKSDLDDFYRDILKTEIAEQALLKEETAEQLFGVPQPVKVHYAKGEGYELELFCYRKTFIPTFRHICIESKRARDIYHSSLEKGYRAVKRKNGDRVSYFITDSNGNMFELKANRTSRDTVGKAASRAGLKDE